MNKIPLVNSNIYEFFVDPNLVDEALEYFLTLPISQELAHAPNVNSAYALYRATPESRYMPFYHEKLFDELQKFVDEVCNLHFRDSKLAICDSWLTKSSFGKNSTIHLHNFSIFSGLVYFSDSRTVTKFTLDDPFYTRNSHLWENRMKDQKYTAKIEPQKGKVVIWDSSIKHSITSHKDKHIRYTLAFNTWLTGTICNDTTSQLYSNVIDVKQRSQ